VAIYQKLLKDYPSNDLADYYLALIYQDSSQWDKAISYALSATKKSPDNRWFQQKLADLYMKNSQFNLAIPVLQKCITLDPRGIDFYQSLIVCHQKANDWNAAFEKAGWKMSEIDHVFMHHVSTSTFNLVADSLQINSKKFYNVIENYGNMAAASIPFAMSEAEHTGTLKKGDKVMIIGLASGISISVQLMIW
jgi:tetratricopeptide (TPR) repeat protein